MTRLLVGTKELRGKLPNYAARYDMVELRPGGRPLPKPNKLRGWRKQVPPSFAFSVVLPNIVGRLETSDEATRALRNALDIARALQAAAIILVTPASIRPTKQNRDKLSALREQLPPDGHLIGWEAHGLWEPEEAVTQAYTSGFSPVLDGIQTGLPHDPVVYTRIHAMGNASNLGASRVTRLADALRGRRCAYVVADGPICKALRAGLQAALQSDRGPLKVPAVFKPGPAKLLVDDEEQ